MNCEEFKEKVVDLFDKMLMKRQSQNANSIFHNAPIAKNITKNYVRRLRTFTRMLNLFAKRTNVNR